MTLEDTGKSIDHESFARSLHRSSPSDHRFLEENEKSAVFASDILTNNPDILSDESSALA